MFTGERISESFQPEKPMSETSTIVDGESSISGVDDNFQVDEEKEIRDVIPADEIQIRWEDQEATNISEIYLNIDSMQNTSFSEYFDVEGSAMRSEDELDVKSENNDSELFAKDENIVNRSGALLLSSHFIFLCASLQHL